MGPVLASLLLEMIGGLQSLRNRPSLTGVTLVHRLMIHRRDLPILLNGSGSFLGSTRGGNGSVQALLQTKALRR